jgi:UDP-3-O-[3-hydroxymyristoyl] glucosamine N-acyltransferase
MTEKIVSVEHLAEMVGGEVVGDKNIRIKGFASLDAAGSDDISFLAKAKMEELLATTKAGAVIVPLGIKQHEGVTIIRVKDPYLAVAIIHGFLVYEPFKATGVHPRAFVGEECVLGQEISLGPLSVLGNRVKLGERVTIEAGAVVGDDVEIGDDSTIKANVTVYNKSVIGKRVTIHSGTVIGSDGYGYSANERGEHIKRPQVGIVRIDDDVEIGANSCIDRAAYGVTWIKSGVAQVGIAGSTTLGRNVVLGGQAAVAGHLSIGDQVMVAARGGVHNNQPKGSVLGGAPAIPVRQWAKANAVFAKLPELQDKVRKNSKSIEELKNKTES